MLVSLLLYAGPAAAQQFASLSLPAAGERGSTGSFARALFEAPVDALIAGAGPSSAAPRSFTGQDRVEATRGERPEMDPVGGLQLSVLGGVQLRGSASGAGGIALGYYKRSTGGLGFEVEGAFTRGPTGDVAHAIFSVVLQSGVRSAKLVPYLAFGGGVYRANERLRDAVREVLPEFGVAIQEQTETGPIIGVGFGVRYYLSPKVSFRADYREFRALTTGEGGFFDRLYALRRIAGFLSFDF
jgi:hypothetical protein